MSEEDNLNEEDISEDQTSIEDDAVLVEETKYPTAVIPEGSTQELALHDDDEIYGYQLKYGTLCTACRHTRLKELNMWRARDHKTYSEISQEFGVPPKILKTHFDNHYIVSPHHQKILSLEETGSSEAREIVRTLFDGNTDILGAGEAVLVSKAERLNIIKNRIKSMSDNVEIDSLDDGEKAEFNNLNKLAESTENSIMDVLQIIDKKLFPFKKDELANAILSYKLKNLKNSLDEIKLVLISFRKKTGMKTYEEFVDELSLELAKRFNKLEEDVYQSGGVIKSNE